jgi:hypothetical protein
LTWRAFCDYFFVFINALISSVNVVLIMLIPLRNNLSYRVVLIKRVNLYRFGWSDDRVIDGGFSYLLLRKDYQYQLRTRHYPSPPHGLVIWSCSRNACLHLIDLYSYWGCNGFWLFLLVTWLALTL